MQFLFKLFKLLLQELLLYKASAKRSISCTKFQQQPKLLLAKSFYSNSKRFRPFPLGPRRRSITCLTHSEKKNQMIKLKNILKD